MVRRINACHDIDKTERLLLAMAPIEQVLHSFEGRSVVDQIDGSKKIGLREQDTFAEMVKSHWKEIGPSDRYLKKVVQEFVSQIENEGSFIESDALADLVLRFSLSKDTLPEGNESCYLSFYLPMQSTATQANDKDMTMPLHIRIFPYHNDVSLRLWEAGACLAEFFLHHPSILEGKDVIELGAGVGLTGLAVAACCKPSSIYLTDYTELCRLNLDHNLQVNQDLLAQYNFEVARISQVGLNKWNLIQ